MGVVVFTPLLCAQSDQIYCKYPEATRVGPGRVTSLASDGS